MFPIKLDGAIVLYYTLQDDYGYSIFPNGEIADYYRYLAICKYSKDDKYYLFCCDENYEVVVIRHMIALKNVWRLLHSTKITSFGIKLINLSNQIKIPRQTF